MIERKILLKLLNDHLNVSGTLAFEMIASYNLVEGLIEDGYKEYSTDEYYIFFKKEKVESIGVSVYERDYNYHNDIKTILYGIELTRRFDNDLNKKNIRRIKI